MGDTLLGEPLNSSAFFDIAVLNSIVDLGRAAGDFVGEFFMRT